MIFLNTPTSKMLSFFVAVLLSQVKADCEINPVATPLSPLLISSTAQDIVYPEIGQTTVKFKADEKVNFGCPSGKLLLRGQTVQDIQEATCISTTQFKVNGTSQNWKDIACSHLATAVGKLTGNNCSDGEEGVIGFSFGSGKFIPQITFCFDPNNQTTLYTHYEIIPQINGAYNKTPLPAFEEDPDFYHTGSQTLNDLYFRPNQRKTINKLLGLYKESRTFIQDGKEYFLTQGNLAARDDFYYPAQMSATFKYVNAAPQWQSFKGKNWEAAGVSTRGYASANKVKLQIWTGTYGITTLMNDDNLKQTQLFLYVNKTEKSIPVPAMYWKLAYHPETKNGVVILGLNNPYQTDINKQIICPDISSKISWMKWQKADIKRGYSYACSIQEFSKVVSYAPNLTVNGLLV